MFKFFIRDIIWLTFLVALCTAWWTDHRQIAQLQQKSRELDSIKDALRAVDMERMIDLMVMFKDPAKESEIKRAWAVMQPTTNPAEWSKEEIDKFVDLMNCKPTP